MTFDCDVAIVGGGPAGLSAALILARACRSAIVFDEGKPRNAVVSHLHGLLSRDGINPRELLELARRDLDKYDSVRIENATVVGARRTDSGFALQLTTGQTYRSRKLLVTTGVTDRLPEIPGIRALYGTSVFHCPFCDAWEFRGQAIAVYGRGDRGYGLALELLGWTHDLVLCTDGASDLTDSQRLDLARHGVTVREQSIRRLEAVDGRLDHIEFATGERLPRRSLFFTTGQYQASPLARDLGCEFNEKGTVRTGRHESTCVPGLFVAGDASRDVQWVVIAAAEGAEAAYAMSLDLIAEDREALVAKPA